MSSLAEGPLATTWLATCRDGPTRGRVALKTIPLAAPDDPDTEDAFLEETSRASVIHHPSVARLLKADRDAGVLYAAFTWSEGQSLRTLLEQFSSTPPRFGVALRLVLALCDAVAAIHLAGLAHRAINPGNFILGPDGSMTVLDTGVSAVLSRASSSTTFRHMIGKFSYLSPEQLWSRPVDARSDVFSLGLLCYQLLVGRHPFRGRQERETTASILSTSAPPPAAQFQVELPAAIEAWLLRALAKPPEERFPDAMAMRHAFLEAIAPSGALASSEEVAALMTSTPHATTLPPANSDRHPPLLSTASVSPVPSVTSWRVAAALLLVCLIGLGSWSLLH